MRAWAELLRVSALFTVPGDALAGAAAAGARPDRGTALAIGASLCLYEAGMALNDWADREEDAIERPGRPIPSGRIPASAALAAAGGLTAAGLALSAGAGHRALAVSTALAATVWAYDLRVKHTPAGPVAMGLARSLDLMLGSVATAGSRTRTPAGGGRSAASLLGAHTLAVTVVSRREAQGGSTLAPLAALAATGTLGVLAGRRRGSRQGSAGGGYRPAATAVAGALAATYVTTAAKPLLHAVLNPSPPLTQRAVGGGIRAMIPLQAALAARSGAAGVALGVVGLAPLARSLARRVSPT
jgi:4-hydroxybenzoate polyprenyltransferase